jgi:hypothetical protein
MIKYKIEFTIGSEDLFRIISKAVPGLNDLHVQEIIEKPVEQPKPRLAKMIEQNYPKLSKPIKKRRSAKPDITSGANEAIMEVLSDGKTHTFSELSKASKEKGFSGTGIGSKLTRLLQHGALIRKDYGIWQITEAGQIIMDEYHKNKKIA